MVNNAGRIVNGSNLIGSFCLGDLWQKMLKKIGQTPTC